MGKVADFLSGTKVLEETKSPINGKLKVVRDLAWGVHIQGGGLTQSGGVAEKVWKTSLAEVKKNLTTNHRSLILGLGGGSIAKLISKFWPGSKITGVEIDPIMVELGKRHMALDSYSVDVVIEDATNYLKRAVSSSEKFDLVCVDMYVEHNVPEQFSRKEFVVEIKKLLTEQGVAVFNRLYFGEKKKQALSFLAILQEEFGTVDIVYPEANVMYVCYGQ